MDYKVQVKRVEKYNEASYVTPRRWSSYAIQVREVMILKPKKILEIGPGNNIVNGIFKKLGFEVETIDLDERLAPDYVSSITDENIIRKLSGRFDLILACQVFEHLKYEDFLGTLKSLQKVSPRIVMSLPYTEINSKFFHVTLKIPGIQKIFFAFKFIYKPIEHKFNGEHYWEIGKKGYHLWKIKADLKSLGWRVDKSFLNSDNPFHYFFVLSYKA